VVPHITDAIRNWIESVAVIPVDGNEGPADVCVIELGGTVGKILHNQLCLCLKLLYPLQSIMSEHNIIFVYLQVILNLCHSLRLCGNYPFKWV
jgi:CTP synthase (UTP-ammonia lyase)